MHLNQIYQPIQRELKEVEETIAISLRKSKNESLLRLNRFLLKAPGKRLRPALVILSAKATSTSRFPLTTHQLTKVASSIELIHMASLIHDDVMDHAHLRHNRPTVNYKWGNDVSIALGDYLYSIAFELISGCGNTDILKCISSATKSMCEGQLIQVLERDNLSLLKERYILIVKKKTARLFAASCQTGTLFSDCCGTIQRAFSNYGLNFGIAFQIVDDYLDLMGEQEKLGKSPGQDIAMGEVTLPLLNLLGTVKKDERQKLIRSIQSKDKDCLRDIRVKFINSDALQKTRKSVLSYIILAKERLKVLTDSDYRESLFDLADFILQPFKIC